MKFSTTLVVLAFAGVLVYASEQSQEATSAGMTAEAITAVGGEEALVQQPEVLGFLNEPGINVSTDAIPSNEPGKESNSEPSKESNSEPSKEQFEAGLFKQEHDTRLVEALNKARQGLGMHDLKYFSLFAEGTHELHGLIQQKRRFFDQGTKLALEALEKKDYEFGIKHYDKNEFDYGTLVPKDWIPPYEFYQEAASGKLIFEYMVGKEQTPEEQVTEWMKDRVRNHSISRDYYFAAGARYTDQGVILYLLGLRPTVTFNDVYEKFSPENLAKNKH